MAQGKKPVIGLMLGWGTIAIHGDEGFRAQFARPLCMFKNGIWDPEWDLLAEEISLWHRIGHGRMRLITSRRHRRLAAAAVRPLGVPLVTLRAAVTSGLLREFGVSSELTGPWEARLRSQSRS
ncbi:MAG: hypothetical protein ACREQM_03185 [Candidatus Dormibacteraceae bacterium]